MLRVKPLLYKHEDLSLDPQHHVKVRYGIMCVAPALGGELGGGGSRSSVASTTKATGAKFTEKSCFKVQGGEQQRKRPSTAAQAPMHR